MSLGIVYRLDKQAPLTFAETDGNFRKLESAYDRLFTAFQEGLPLTAVSFDDYAADTVRYRRADNGTQNQITIARFAESLINQAPLLVGDTGPSFGVLVTDPNAAPGTKAQLVDMDRLLPPVIEAGTFSPSSITVRRDGRISALSGSSKSKSVSGLPIPPVVHGSTTIWTHGLEARPRFISVTMVCAIATGNSAGYVKGDEIDFTAFLIVTGADTGVPLVIERSISQIVVRAARITGYFLYHKTNGSVVNPINPLDWTLSIEAIS